MKKLIVLLILIISVQLIIAQPIIGIGKSKYFITNHMAVDHGWKLTRESKTELVYSNGSSSFTYFFKKDSPCNINKTCVKCMAEFKTPANLDQYISEKVKAWKLKPDPDSLNLIVVTDLYNDTIQAVVIGDKRIIFSY